MNNYFLDKQNKLLVFSFVGVIFYVVSYFNRALSLPDFYREFCCSDDRMLNIFLIAIPLFIFSLLFNRTGQGIWKKFSLLYLVGYSLVYILMPSQGDGYIWFQKETVSFLGTILYSAISLFIIIYKSPKKENPAV